jgi:hypothetical protein
MVVLEDTLVTKGLLLKQERNAFHYKCKSHRGTCSVKGWLYTDIPRP